MENKSGEPAKKESTVLHRVRDRVVALHDKHLKVTKLSEHVVERFNALVPEVASQKGKRLVEWLRPKIADLAKSAEVAVAVGEVAIGVVAGGVGVDSLVRVIRTPPGTNSNTAMQEMDHYPHAIKHTKRAMGAGVTSGIFLGVRPVTRFVDMVFQSKMLPLAKRIVGGVDGILLRQEQKHNATHPVYFGSSKA